MCRKSQAALRNLIVLIVTCFHVSQIAGLLAVVRYHAYHVSQVDLCPCRVIFEMCRSPSFFCL